MQSLTVALQASFRHLISTGFHYLFPRCILITVSTIISLFYCHGEFVLISLTSHIGSRISGITFWRIKEEYNLTQILQDIATRHMIKYISLQNKQMPILALVDGDIYGLDIYAVYKWGSHVSGWKPTPSNMLTYAVSDFKAQAFDAPNLAVRDIQLLGLCSKDKSR